MNTTELQMILEAVGKLGEEGKSAFVWWLVMKHGLDALFWIMLVTIVPGVIYVLVRRGIDATAEEDLAKINAERDKWVSSQQRETAEWMSRNGGPKDRLIAAASAYYFRDGHPRDPLSKRAALYQHILKEVENDND